MRFQETPLAGAFVIDLEKIEDERGFFARAFCRNEFAAHGLSTDLVQVNNSLARDKGTLRGMHYQLAPHAETKLVRCIRGALWDAIRVSLGSAPMIPQTEAEFKPRFRHPHAEAEATARLWSWRSVRSSRSPQGRLWYARPPIWPLGSEGARAMRLSLSRAASSC